MAVHQQPKPSSNRSKPIRIADGRRNRAPRVLVCATLYVVVGYTYFATRALNTHFNVYRAGAHTHFHIKKSQFL